MDCSWFGNFKDKIVTSTYFCDGNYTRSLVLVLHPSYNGTSSNSTAPANGTPKDNVKTGMIISLTLGIFIGLLLLGACIIGPCGSVMDSLPGSPEPDHSRVFAAPAAQSSQTSSEANRNQDPADDDGNEDDWVLVSMGGPPVTNTEKVEFSGGENIGRGPSVRKWDAERFKDGEEVVIPQVSSASLGDIAPSSPGKSAAAREDASQLSSVAGQAPTDELSEVAALRAAVIT